MTLTAYLSYFILDQALLRDDLSSQIDYQSHDLITLREIILENNLTKNTVKRVLEQGDIEVYDDIINRDTVDIDNMTLYFKDDILIKIDF